MCGEKSEIAVAPRGSLSSAAVRSAATRDGIEPEVPDDPVQIGVLILQDLIQPMHQLDVGIAAHLAKSRRPFDALVTELVEFSEESRAADFHGIGGWARELQVMNEPDATSRNTRTRR